jgi:hypothetical protein
MHSLKFTLGLLAVMVGGCAGQDAADTEATSSQVTQTSSVKIVEERIHETIGQCAIDLVFLTPDVSDRAAARKMYESLRSSIPQSLQQLPCDRPATFHGEETVRFNERGVLSVMYRADFFAEGAAHPSGEVRTWNFDVATGELIDFDVAFDWTAHEAFVDACMKTDTVVMEGPCKQAVMRTTWRAPVYTIEAGGVRIHPTDVPHVLWVYATEGILVPWSNLAGHITNTKIAALAPQ